MSAVVSRRASLDIDVITDAIKNASGTRAAERFASRLRTTLDTLRRFPEIGEEVDPPFPRFPGLRRYLVRRMPWYVVYHIRSGEDVLVVRVVHAAQDADAIFG